MIMPSSGGMQPARYQFPTFNLSCILPQMAWIILCKNQPGSDSASSPEASLCARIINHGSASGQCFQSRSDWMRIRSSAFTGRWCCYQFLEGDNGFVQRIHGRRLHGFADKRLNATQLQQLPKYKTKQKHLFNYQAFICHSAFIYYIYVSLHHPLSPDITPRS